MQSLLHPVASPSLFATLQSAGAGGGALGVVNNAIRIGGGAFGARGMIEHWQDRNQISEED